MTTGFRNVVVPGALRGFTFPCATPITVIVDADPLEARAGAIALRVLAGIVAPAAGEVSALGGDPRRDAALRRSIALLGDPALLEGESDPVSAARELAAVRGVTLASTDAGDVRTICDRLANPAAARLVLAAYPETYIDDRARMMADVEAAIARGVPVVIATRELDTVLALSPDDRAMATILRDGIALTSAPAHALPWSVPWEGATTRLVRVLLASSEVTPPPSAKLAADLLADGEVAASIVQAETISPTELRVRTRDPRAVARAIGARAKEGLQVRALDVAGATTSELAGAR